MQLIDIGVNLGHKSFHSDRAQVLARARAAGVDVLIVTGTTVAASRAALQLAQEHPGVLYATAGVHPHDAARCDEHTIEQLQALASARAVVAIGECGLDFNRDFSPRPLQLRWFAAQVELAVRLGRPLFLHERDAHAAFIEVLDRHLLRGGAPQVPAVVHCFTGSEGELLAYLRRGFYIGVTGWVCDERRGLPLQRLLPQIPLDRLLLETDAPFLVPRDLRPRPPLGRNEPAFLVHILHTVARCSDRPVDEVAAATTANARRFFNLPETPCA